MVKNIIKDKFKNKRKTQKRQHEEAPASAPVPPKRLRAVTGLPNYLPRFVDDSVPESIAAANEMREGSDVEARSNLMDKTFAWRRQLTVTKNKTPSEIKQIFPHLLCREEVSSRGN